MFHAAAAFFASQPYAHPILGIGEAAFGPYKEKPTLRLARIGFSLAFGTRRLTVGYYLGRVTKKDANKSQFTLGLLQHR